MSSSCLPGQVRFGGGGSSLHSGIEFGRSRTGEGSSGGRKKGVVGGVGQERLGPSYFFIPLVLGPLNSLVWYVPSLRYTRGLGWRMHCGVEVTESSTNKQHHLSPCIPSCAVVHRDARAPQILPARNIDCMHNIAARTQHYSVHAATAQCTCIPACALRKRSGTREVEVLRCFRAQCLPSLSKSLTSVRWSKETSHKKSFPPCIPSAGEQQSTSHAPFSYPNPAGPVRAAAL